MKGVLQIVKSVIIVSKNDLIETGYFVQHKVWGILPNCRKVQLLSFSTMTGYVWVRALYSYNGKAGISPSDWLALVKSSPVRAERVYCPGDQVVLTPELIELAYREASSIADNPCANDFTYSPKYDTLRVPEQGFPQESQKTKETKGVK